MRVWTVEESPASAAERSRFSGVSSFFSASCSEFSEFS